jgi:hypothetical protein
MVAFPAMAVKPEDHGIQVGACANVFIQPTLAVPGADRGKNAQLIMYIFITDKGVGVMVPARPTVTLTAATKFDLLSEPLDFTTIPGLNFYVYYGYALGSSIKYSVYSVDVQAFCPDK